MEIIVKLVLYGLVSVVACIGSCSLFFHRTIFLIMMTHPTYMGHIWWSHVALLSGLLYIRCFHDI